MIAPRLHRGTVTCASLLTVCMLGGFGLSAWAENEDERPLAASLGQTETSVTLAQAVLTAVAAIPGRAVEAQLSADEGRIVYEIEIIDLEQDLRRVYVDAEAGKVIKVWGAPLRQLTREK
jgi:Peptidase propeptide and YPEB domain